MGGLDRDLVFAYIRTMTSEHTHRASVRGIRRRWRAHRAWRLLVTGGIAALLAHGVVHAAGPARPPRVVVVRPGQTLWTLGRRYAPSGTDLRRWVFEVERLNGLHHADLVAGEAVRVPR